MLRERGRERESLDGRKQRVGRATAKAEEQEWEGRNRLCCSKVYTANLALMSLPFRCRLLANPSSYDNPLRPATHTHIHTHTYDRLRLSYELTCSFVAYVYLYVRASVYTKQTHIYTRIEVCSRVFAPVYSLWFPARGRVVMCKPLLSDERLTVGGDSSWLLRNTQGWKEKVEQRSLVALQLATVLR